MSHPFREIALTPESLPDEAPSAAPVIECLPAQHARDRAAVTRVLEGDREAFGELVEEYERSLFAFLRRLTGNACDAEDLCQESFVRAFVRLAQYDSTRPFRPWLYRIATNLALSAMRARSAQPRLVAGLLPGDEEGALPDDPPDRHAVDPRESLARTQRRRLAAQAMEQLTPDDRAIIILHYEREVSIDGISAIVQKSPNAVKVALHRARQRLRLLIAAAQETRS